MNYNFPFEYTGIKVSDKSIKKICVSYDSVVSCLHFLKNNAEFDFDRLNTTIGVDLGDKFELIYDLYSTKSDANVQISTYIDKNLCLANSVTSVYKSAYFDECEIFDLLGINFVGNKKLKRLFMPKGWVGYPLRKDYVFEDKRLSWGVEDGK